MTRDIEAVLAAEAEAAEQDEYDVSDPDEPLRPDIKVTRGHGRSRTLQVRLNGDEYEELELLAKARNLPVSTVARGLLLDSIAPSDTIQESVARLEQDLMALRRQVDR